MQEVKSLNCFKCNLLSLFESKYLKVFSPVRSFLLEVFCSNSDVITVNFSKVSIVFEIAYHYFLIEIFALSKDGNSEYK